MEVLREKVKVVQVMADKMSIEEIESVMVSLKVAGLDFSEKFKRISTYPFREYQIDLCERKIREILYNIAEFYEIDLSPSRGEEYEYMHRQCITYKLMGILHDIDFPEEEKFMYIKDGRPSWNYMELLFYRALVFAMPKTLVDKIRIEGQKDVWCRGCKYRMDIAIMDQYGAILYDVECDGDGHNAESDGLRDENIMKEIPQCKIIRIPKKEIYDGFEGKKASEKNYAMNTAKSKVWDVIETDLTDANQQKEQKVKRSLFGLLKQ